jgi:hypothetical protein
MKKYITLTLIISVLLTSTVLADGNNASYVGGSTKDKDFPGAKDKVEGSLHTGDDKLLRFDFKLNKETRSYSIPYDQFIDIEYGQKAGRRVGAAIATAVLLAPVGLFLLFSKKRKHYVTIGYKDAEGKEQVAVFELSKDIARTTLSILETRSGKKIEYQDEEAKKSGRGN